MSITDGLDLVSPHAYANNGVPHELWTRLRAESPVHRCEPKGFAPFWAITKHADICEISKQPEIFSSSEGIAMIPLAQEEIVRQQELGGSMRVIIEMDPPEHRGYRGVASPVFTPRTVKAMDGAIRTSSREIVDRLAGDTGEGECDFANDVAAAHPLRILSTMLGVPRESEPDILRLTNELFASDDPDLQREGEDRKQATMAMALEFYQLFDKIIQDRRANPRDDLASLLANAEIDGEPMGMMETLGYYLITFIAGHDTTKNALVGGMLALLENPDQFALLKSDPELLDSAVEEVVRWTSPVNHMKRKLTQDYELRGQKLSAGDWVVMFYASANRDEEVFDAPFEFRIDRKPNPHLAFGIGEHFCLGANLARRSQRALLEELAQRLEWAELAGEPEQIHSAFVVGLKKVAHALSNQARRLRSAMTAPPPEPLREPATLSSPFRVLDLSDERGVFCGFMLAELGADVVCVEPPGGSRARRQGPFAQGLSNPEHSLFWWAYARGKRSIVLDPKSPSDREELLRLADDADVLIESQTPGEMQRLGLGYEELAHKNPGLVYVSITAFGQTGPKARWAASDLTVLASSGALWLTGDEDRAPVRVSVPQTFLHAGAEAAAAALVALHERRRSGLGQHVDVSAQQSMALATQSDIVASAIQSSGGARIAGGGKIGPLSLRFQYPARDGHVSITHLFGRAFGPATARLMQAVCEDGFCDETLRGKDWVALAALIAKGSETVETHERAKDAIAAWTASKTKSELLEIAMERRLLLAPAWTLRDVASNQQLDARQYFQEFERPDDQRKARQLGAFLRVSGQPEQARSRAPRVGEHGEALLSETRSPHPSRPMVRVSDSTDTALPLADVKIVDFMWALAGPVGTRMLADYGAEVVRVESATKHDPIRGGRPLRGAPVRDGDRRALSRRQREQADAGTRPRQAGNAGGRPRPRAPGGRRLRVLHTGRNGSNGHRLRGAARSESRPRDAQYLADGPDRPPRDVLGLREPLCSHRGIP